MKHESIIVVYDSCQALAEEIADLLGAESISVQSVNNRYVENGQSFVLAVEYQTDGHLTTHWQYAFQTFCRTDLSGKKFALFVALGNIQDHDTGMELCDELRKGGAHIVGDLPNAVYPSWKLDNWVCSISPNL